MASSTFVHVVVVGVLLADIVVGWAIVGAVAYFLWRRFERRHEPPIPIRRV